MWRDDALALEMLLAARKVLRFTADVDEERFYRDDMVQSAVTFAFGVLGEAARKVSSGYRQARPSVPWPELAGLRNRLIHEYFRIDLARVWHIIRHDLAPLVAELEKIVPSDESPEKP
jgi:uncharacterized protein with HEPN domain